MEPISRAPDTFGTVAERSLGPLEVRAVVVVIDAKASLMIKASRSAHRRGHRLVFLPNAQRALSYEKLNRVDAFVIEAYGEQANLLDDIALLRRVSQPVIVMAMEPSLVGVALAAGLHKTALAQGADAFLLIVDTNSEVATCIEQAIERKQRKRRMLGC